MKRKAIVLSVGILLTTLIAPFISVTVAKEKSIREINVTVDKEGYHPSIIPVDKGETVSLIFTRKTDKTCVTRVLIPDLNIDLELPLNKPVSVDVKVSGTKEIGFTCPTDMLKGKLITGGGTNPMGMMKMGEGVDCPLKGTPDCPMLAESGKDGMMGGKGMKEMRDCPMMLKGVRTEVKELDDGVTITYRSDDKKVVKRLQAMGEMMKRMKER